MSAPQFPNLLGTASVSLGGPKQHSLESRLRAASAAGFKAIDLFDECWEEYLKSAGQDPSSLWDATPENLRIARQLGDLVTSLGMRIVCTQPLRNIEGVRDEEAREEALGKVEARFPFMRAFGTDLCFLCSSMTKEPKATLDFKTVARDLRELGLRAEEYARRDGGPMLRIGYEHLSWGQRNTWAAAWEVVRAANRPNVGLIVDSFNLLGAEFADPYNAMGHGRIYDTLEESMDVLRMSLASLVATVPGECIFLVQLADGQLMDPKTFPPPSDPEVPGLLPWSRKHRLYPTENDRGAYLPVDMVTAAFLATGYKGPLSLEVFNASLYETDPGVPVAHAERGYRGLTKVIAAAREFPRFWGEPAQDSEAYRLLKEHRKKYSNIQ